MLTPLNPTFICGFILLFHYWFSRVAALGHFPCFVSCPATCVHVLVITLTVHDCIPDGFIISGTAYLPAYQISGLVHYHGAIHFPANQVWGLPSSPSHEHALSLLISKLRETLHFILDIQNFVSHPPPHTIGFFFGGERKYFFSFFFFFRSNSLV